MWGLRELADAAEDFADAAEEAVQHIIRIRNATGRAARACGTAASILAAGVGDAASAFAPLLRVLAAGVGDAASAFAPLLRVLAAGMGDAASAFAPLLRVFAPLLRFFAGVFGRPKLSRQERRREIREAEHEARKLRREILACLEKSGAHRIPVRYPLPLPRLNPGCHRPRRRGHANATGNGI